MKQLDKEGSVRGLGGLKIMIYASLILGIVSFGWLIYDFYALLQLKRKASQVDIIANVLGIGFIPDILFHLLAFLTLIAIFRFFKGFQIRATLAFASGVLSLIWQVMDFMALSDIYKQYILHDLDASGEWLVVFLGFGPHLLFYLLIFSALVSFLKSLKKAPGTRQSMINEGIFISLQVIGFFCGLLGILFTLSLSGYLRAIRYDLAILRGYLGPFSLLVLLPYLVVLLAWLLLGRKERYDEKQRSDLKKAGITTWLFSIPFMTTIFILNLLGLFSSSAPLWYPYYLFISLLVFSAGTLIYYRK